MLRQALLATSLCFLAIGCTKKENNAQPPATPAAAEATSAASVNKGVGPITSVTLEAVNADLAGKGKTLFEAKCSACHKVEERYVGPALKGVTTRRSAEWIMNMILNPAEMLEKDATAKELLAEYMTQMTFQNVTQDEARQLLEYFRQNDGGK